MAICTRLLLGLEPHERQHRPEHLDLAELAGRVDVAEHGRLDVEAVGEVAAGDAAADEQLGGAVGLGPLDHAEDPLLGRPADDRAHAGRRIERVAEGDVAGEGDDLLGELVVDAVVHDEPGGEGAALAGEGLVDRGGGDERDRVEVGVGEHEAGRLAAELEHRRLQASRRRSARIAPGRGRARR